MRVNINLATQPYQDVKRFLRRWGSIAALVAVLTGVLVYLAVSGYMQSRDVNRQIADLRAEMAKLDRAKADAVAILNRPENRDTTERSQALNELIARKAFSWTQVFSDMERIVPRGLHVVSIRPEINDQNQLEVRLTVAGESRDRANELVRKLEENPHFASAAILNETAQLSGNQQSPVVQFDISALYVPEGTRPTSPSTATQAASLDRGGQ
jgi:type IV pilus assembly protein PilN